MNRTQGFRNYWELKYIGSIINPKNSVLEELNPE